MIEKKEISIKSSIINELKIDPTNDQLAFITKISKFLNSDHQKDVFILKGYAGTGKTTCISAVINAIGKFRMRSVLLAPTGKAAKVMNQFSGKSASTIHRKIYQRTLAKDGNIHFGLAANLHTNTIFFVDEASMIQTYSGITDGGSNYRNLLEDLFEFIYSGKNCKLVLIGDQMQLPPVGMDESPALDLNFLRNEYALFNFDSITLKTVVRQDEESGILENATMLRSLNHEFPVFKSTADFVDLSGQDLQEELDNSINQLSTEDTIVLCRSNKRANLFNESIRRRILWMEEDISAGDILMVVKNNYFWLGENSEAGFIANGDTIQIEKINQRETLYGFDFVGVRAKLVDYPKMESFDVKLCLDTLSSESPSLSRERMKEFFFEVEKDYLDEKNRKKRYEKILQNPYFNALQVKFAYAITGHKSQGGQWAHVFIDQGYFVDDMMNHEYNRWLYTAITRATEKVYLINFNKKFFPDREE